MSISIPYEVTPRRDTGVNNAKLGIWLFLASEVMLFGGLFASYVFLRIGAESWPGMLAGHEYHRAADVLNVPLATLNTLVLIASSVTIVMSWASLKMNDFKKYRLYMSLTVLAAFVFLIIKAFEYGDKFSHGYYPETSTFLAIYFTLTGLHALHVTGGIILNCYLLGRLTFTLVIIAVVAALTYLIFGLSLNGLLVFLVVAALAAYFAWRSNNTAALWQRDPEHFTNRVEVAGLYWHFVDLVWIFLFPTIYLL